MATEMKAGSLEWYKSQLEEATRFIQEQIHPRYGPCDGIASGECSECLRVLGILKTDAAKYHTLKNQVSNLAQQLTAITIEDHAKCPSVHPLGLCQQCGKYFY